jgi:hypothetical protein
LNYPEYWFTITDLTVLTQTWTSAWRKLSLNDRLLENCCTTEQNAGHLRKPAEEAGRAK